MTAHRSTAAVLAIALAIVVAYTWPLVTVLPTAQLHYLANPTILMRADMGLYAWCLRWDVHRLLTHPLALFDANIMYPLRDTLAFSDHLLGVVLPIIPVDLIWRDAIVDFNVAVLLALTLGIAGSVLLVRELGGSLTAGFVAGALTVLIPTRLSVTAAVQQVSTHWMPFTLLFLHRLLATGRWRAGVGFATCFVLTALVSPYFFFYFGTTVALFVVFHLLCRRPTAPGAYRVLFAAAVAIALVLLPTFMPYLRAREVYGLWRDPAEAILLSARGDDFLGALTHPVTFAARRYLGEDGLVPVVGWGTFVLIAVAIGAAVRRRGPEPGAVAVFMLVAVSTAVLSLGPRMRLTFWSDGVPGPYALLVRFVPGFDALRTPVRLWHCTFVVLGGVIGLGADVLLRGARGRTWRALGALVVAAAVVADCWTPGLQLVAAEGQQPIPAPYRWLASAAEGQVAELPYGAPNGDALAMVYSTYHWHPLLNGYSGFTPVQAYGRSTLFRFPDAASLRYLHDLGIRYVVVHPKELFPSQITFCTQPGRWSAYLARRAFDATGCVFELTGAPPDVPPSPERRVDPAGGIVTSSSGGPPPALLDDDRRTHWTQTVDKGAPGWLQVDLPEPHVLTRVDLRLGRYFGDYPRMLTVQVSADGDTWDTILDRSLTEPPLVSYRDHPDDVTMTIHIPKTTARHLRLVRPPAVNPPLGVYETWHAWGAEAIDLYERAPDAPTPPA